jgi:RNA polymerase sigma factor (sigma-70 family)
MTESTTFRVAATLRLHHGRLTEVLQARGWSQRELARYLGVSWQQVNAWMNFRRRPPTDPEVWRKLMELTGCADDELFPPALYQRPATERPVTRFTTVRDVALETMLPRVRPQLPRAPSAEEVYAAAERSRVVQGALTCLSPRQQELVSKRFGLDGEAPWGLDELARHFQVSRERIRQLEAQAMRKLRHPARAHRLRPLLTGERVGVSPLPRADGLPTSASGPAEVHDAALVPAPLAPPPLAPPPPVRFPATGVLVAPTDLADVCHVLPGTVALCRTPHPCLTGQWRCTCGAFAIAHAALTDGAHHPVA